jgi:hypothetical protein
MTYRPSAVMLRRPSPATQNLLELEASDVDTVRAGRVAWRRLRDSSESAASFESHMLVARAVKALRETALKRLSSKTGRKSTVHNGGFNWIMAGPLKAHELDDMTPTYRWAALWCLENLDECRRILGALREGERAFHNFPPHVRGLVIAARRPDDSGNNHLDRRSPAARLRAVTETCAGISHSLAMTRSGRPRPTPSKPIAATPSRRRSIARSESLSVLSPKHLR